MISAKGHNGTVQFDGRFGKIKPSRQGCGERGCDHRAAVEGRRVTNKKALSESDICDRYITPAPFVQRLMGLLPERVKWRAFIKAQKKRGAYLKPGDVVRSTIKSADRRIDLGEQLLRITWIRSTDNQDHGRRAVCHISGGTS
jgi:hypothetical protein